MAIAMAELKALCRIHPKTLTDSDVAAAQQLVQLSGEDSSNDNKEKKQKKKRRKKESIESDFEDEYQEFDGSSQNEITSRMIEEIFGKEEEVIRPRKKRYRSLVSIYREMDGQLMSNVRYGNKVSIEENPNGVLVGAAEAN